MRKAGVITACIVLAAAVLYAGLLTNAFGMTSINREAAAAPEAETNGMYLPHAPIIINGNGNFTSPNGVTGGTGTMNDPWIISGWEINITAVGTGISISSTTDYFVISDCHIYSQSSNMSNGTKMTYVSNGFIEHNNYTGSYIGIWLFWSNNNVISGNDITCHGYNGIRIGYSENNVITNNKIHSNIVGIEINCQSCRNTITYNNISYSNFYGLTVVQNCDYNRINHNDFVNNSINSAPGAKQANDTSGKNLWNTSSEGNYWHDWTGPDTSPADGIVDSPYILDGGKGANDSKPLVNTVPVPQFPAGDAVLMGALLMVLIVAVRRKVGKPE